MDQAPDSRESALLTEASASASSAQQVVEVVARQLESMLSVGNYDGVKVLLAPVQPVDVAEAIGSLPRTLQALAFRLLPKDEAIEVYEYLEPPVQQSLLERLRSGEVLELVEEMSPDDRVRLFDELPAKVVRRLLAELSPAERRVTAQLLGYASETAGRLMTTEYIDLKEFHSAAQALAIVRRRARDTETVYSLYVTDAERHLTGILSLRDLVTADPEDHIGDVMTRDVVSINTDTDQEEVARAIQRYDFLAVPVVDREMRLVGIVTVDDVIDVIEQEATRDLYAAGAVEAGDEDDYFQSNLFTVARRRVVWLSVLVVASLVTSEVIAVNEDVLKEVVLLAAFIPLLAGTGGNVGAQSSTVVIRGLSTQSIASLGQLKAVAREAMAGLLLGLLMMVLVVPFAWWRGQSPLVGLSVGTSLLAITTLAATAGAGFPLLFNRMGLDPALMSTPFITTCTDVVGTLIYLKTAQWLLVHWPQLLQGQVFLPISSPQHFSERTFTFLRSTLHTTQRSDMAPALAAASVANAAKISAKGVASTKSATAKASGAKASPSKGASSKSVAVRPAGTDVDLVRSYLRDIGRVPLLSHQQEITLGRQVQELMDLEAQEAELSDQRGGEAVPAAELAKAAGLSPVQLKRKLQAGRRAKERMVAANLRLVVSVAKKYTKRNMELLDLIQEGTIGLVRGVEKFDPTRGYKFSTYAYWWIRQGITRAIAEKSRTIRLPIHITEMLNKLKKGQRELSQELGRTPSVTELAAFVELPEDDVKDLMCRARQPVSLEMKVGDGDDTELLDLLAGEGELPSEQVEGECLKGDLRDLLGQLPELQERVLRMRYGMDGEDPMSLTGIGRVIGISRDRVRNLERDGLAGLRRLSDQVEAYVAC